MPDSLQHPSSRQLLPILGGGHWDGRSYVPLEAWRTEQAASLFQGGLVARAFRSSGTTGAVRSTSLFSAAGLAAYKAQSVWYFLEMLRQVLSGGPAAPQALASVQGFSLVPPVAQWPDSSLAQMVAWIGEVLPVQYCVAETLRHQLAAVDRPVWLFGTAFHLLNVIDAGLASSLPPGSVIIETGGTKGQAREVTREELYTDLSQAFGVPLDSVVSEYGMCELACQAYDYVPRGDTCPLAERRFRFPPWVEVAVLTAPRQAAADGRGALLVHDRLRLDVPQPLRTEDLAELNRHGFKLLGRAPSQPLKGCSLLAEDLPAAASWHAQPAAAGGVQAAKERSPDSAFAPAPTPERHAGPVPGESLESHQPRHLAGMAARIATIHPCLQAFLAAPSSVAVLSEELGSEAAAAAALSDTLAGLPKTPLAWRQAALQATAGTLPPAWLMILPANHSLVGLYPLALAYVLGLEVGARLPQRFATGGNLLRSFIDALRGLPDSRIEALPAGKLTPGLARRYQAVLAYGSDETLADLRQRTDLPVRGFGSRAGVRLIAAHSCSDHAAAIARDALSLGQAGCLSTRLVVVSGALGPAPRSLEPPIAAPGSLLMPFARALSTAAQRFWQAPLPWRARIGLDYEAWRLTAAGADILVPEHSAAPLVAVKVLPGDLSAAVAEPLLAMIARAPFTIPIVWCPRGDGQATALLKLWTRSKALQKQLLINGLEFGGARPGEANQPQWDGSHEGQPLFSLADAL